jgi:hypothetical protein
MDTTKAEAPQAASQAAIAHDYNAVKQTINDFMTGNIDAATARNKFQDEVSLMARDQTTDAVASKLQASSKLPSEFPNLSFSADSTGDSLTYKEASSKNRNQVDFFHAGPNTAITVTSESEAQTKDAANAKLLSLADQVLTVSGEYLSGKINGSDAAKQIAPLMESGRDKSATEDQYESLELAIGAQAYKYGQRYTNSSWGDFGLSSAAGSSWNTLEFDNGKIATSNGTVARLESDAAYGAAGAVAGSWFGPVGAAVGAAGGVVVGEIQHYEADKAIKLGNTNVFDQRLSSQIENIGNGLDRAF